MTYCCNNIKEAYELIGRVQNKLNWRPEGFSFGDYVGGVLTLNTSSGIKVSKQLERAIDEMVGAFNLLNQARTAINLCSCGSERDFYKNREGELVNKYNNLSSNSADNYSNLKERFEDLAKNSVSKDKAEELVKRFEEVWKEYKKNIEDYNRLARNSVSKEAFERLEVEYKKNVNDYNELIGEQKTLVERAKNLQEKYNKLVDDYNDKVTDYQDMKERYEDTNEKLHGEKLGHANEMGDEKLKHLGEKSQLQIQNTKLQEKLEAANSEKIDLRKRLKDKEVENDRLLIKLDDKNNQLTVLRIESGKKDSDLERKSEEIKNLKNQAKSSDKRAEKSQEDLLNEKIRSEKGNLELFATELRVGLEQTNGLTRYHERLFRARKIHNQANIETHENNITQIKEELQDAGISIVNIQEVCRKCERIAELSWELEQNQYKAQQEVPTNH